MQEDFKQKGFSKPLVLVYGFPIGVINKVQNISLMMKSLPYKYLFNAKKYPCRYL